MSIELTKLDNGIHVVTDVVPTVESVALGVWASVGARNECPAENGVAHMVEHMLFKGTPSRTHTDIAESIENVGGYMNAYTGRETTGYYAHMLKEDANLALEVLSDMVQHSTMDEDELSKERGVVIQEIGMYEDTPDELVFDVFQETAYPGQAVGAPILGTVDIIQDMPQKTLLNYVQQFYTGQNLYISGAGNIVHDDFAQKVDALFTSLPKDQESKLVPAVYKGGDFRDQKELEQLHVILGFNGLSKKDPDFFAQKALSTILSGGSASRLTQEIREKRGLVYSIYGFSSSFMDDGVYGIYAGTGPNRVKELMPVMCDEILNIQENITDEELSRAKAKMKASMLKGQESMVRRMDSQVKHFMTHGALIDTDALAQKIDALQKEDLLRVAKRIFSSKPTLSALGDLSHLESYEKIKERLAA